MHGRRNRQEAIMQKNDASLPVNCDFAVYIIIVDESRKSVSGYGTGLELHSRYGAIKNKYRDVLDIVD